MYNLFLDDERTPEVVGNYINPWYLRAQYRLEPWVIVRSYFAFVNKIKTSGLPNKVSFDHDLAEIKYDVVKRKASFKYKEKTGLDCAIWLISYCMDNKIKLPETYVHSMNPVGADNIKNLLKNFREKFEQ